jgi:ribosome-associated heat shock protein Hsp15
MGLAPTSRDPGAAHDATIGTTCRRLCRAGRIDPLMPSAETVRPETLRIDKVLWFLRFAASRSLAQDWVGEGHIRLNGRRIERASAVVRCGDVLVLPLHTGVRVVTLTQLPTRRGPAEEAYCCYQVLDAPAPSPLARSQIEPEGISLP